MAKSLERRPELELLGQNIRAARKARGMTMEELAYHAKKAPRPKPRGYAT